jgi:uncharacterized protein
MIITSIYASLLAVLFFVLSARVILLRRVVGVGLNDGGNDHLRRLIRVHGNFAEYVPFILLLILVAETENRTPWMIHCLGILLVIGRIFHALGVGKNPEIQNFRVIGMAMTLTVLLAAAALNIAMLVLRNS